MLWRDWVRGNGSSGIGWGEKQRVGTHPECPLKRDVSCVFTHFIPKHHREGSSMILTLQRSRLGLRLVKDAERLESALV